MFRDFSSAVNVLFSNFHPVKIADNTLKAVYDYSIRQLSDLYEENEIRSMMKIAMAHFFNFDSKYLAMNPNLRFTESELLKFVFLSKELKQGRPLQYILGHTEFYGLNFLVNEDVLIPRQETEELVDWMISDLKSEGDLNVLDIGTGSACIAISLKKNLAQAGLHAVDISEPALETAKKNAEINGVELTFTQDDILRFDAGKYLDSYDCIVSNPPYVLLSEKERMHRNVVEHEPHLALFVVDEEALVYYKAIAGFAKAHLKKGGKLYFEINEQYAHELNHLLVALGFNDVHIRKDLNGKDRMVRATLP